MCSKTKTILIVSCLLAFNCSEGLSTEPLFKNSIVFTEFDFITSDDPNAFKSLRFLGQGRREMPDKRNNKLFANDTFIFEASFRDDSKVKIWAHSSFGSMEVAERYANMLSGPLGKLPELMREKLSHVVIHKGDETAFAESDGHFFVLYSENMETRVRNHDLEETVFHESVHATLDSKHNKSKAWLSAQKADDDFITEYAARNPTKEDLPESALFAYTMLKHPGRLPSEVEQWVHNHMPNRLAFFRRLFPEPKEKKAEAANSRLGGTVRSVPLALPVCFWFHIIGWSRTAGEDMNCHVGRSVRGRRLAGNSEPT